jgi:hypothetical protein
MGVPAMEILAVIIVLHLLLFAAAWSSARSYFAKGRLAGMEEATREIIRGIGSHYEVAGKAAPDHVAKAIEAINTFTQRASCEKDILRYHTRLWTFGDAVGSACWRKGFETCRQEMTPQPGRIRIDMPVDDLQYIASLADLGFRKMMPNDRGIETRRFEGETHALEVTRAVERLELAIPPKMRPTGQASTRQAMIRHWWPLERKIA